MLELLPGSAACVWPRGRNSPYLQNFTSGIYHEWSPIMLFASNVLFVFGSDGLSSLWKMPPFPTGTALLPLVPMSGTISLCLFPAPPPLLSLAFPEAFPPPFNDYLDFSFALCCFSFAASWGPALKPHSVLFPLLILLFLFPCPFSQSNTRRESFDSTSQSFS